MLKKLKHFFYHRDTKKHIYILGCVYTQNRLTVCTEIIKLLHKIFNRYFDITTLIIYNGDNFNELKKISIDIIAGSNKNAEFSAWQEGIEYLKANSTIQVDAKFIFFNDTLFNHYFPNIVAWASFLQFIKNDSGKKSIISGELVSLPKVGSVCMLPINKFVRSALFYINYPAISDLNFTLLNFKVSELKEGCKNSFELLNQHLDENLLSYRIGNYLFGGLWYRSRNYHEFPIKEIKLKLAMLINELLLSAILQKKTNVFHNSLMLSYTPLFALKQAYSLLSAFNLVSLIFFLKLYLYGRRLRSKIQDFSKLTISRIE